MGFLGQLFVKPALRCDIEGVAETQNLKNINKIHENEKSTEILVEDVSGYRAKSKTRVVDRWLDAVVRASGSAVAFSIILAMLIAWALIGIRFGTQLVWKAFISDVQAILCYVFDSFLMRQLLNAYEEEQMAAAMMRSRLISHKRMLGKLKNRLAKDDIVRLSGSLDTQPQENFEGSLKPLGLFGRIIIISSRALGHIATVCMYWVCIFIWLGFGHYCGWTNTWQLYINSATSALMVFVFAFLACLRECYSDYTNICMDAIYRVNACLELELRILTDDESANEPVLIPAPKENWLQLCIYYYADVVGTLVGIIILVVVIAVWIAVGPVLKFNNNWWLLIGTYAGLVGLFDSFVLRNIQGRLKHYENVQAEIIEKEEEIVFETIGIDIPVKETVNSSSLSYRISAAVGEISSHLLMVVAGFLLTVGCVVGSSVMRWNETGQLISNIPPSIIETFFMLILITGQIYMDASARVNFKNIYNRRQRLLAFVKAAKGTRPGNALVENSDIDLIH
ncbi:low-affinity Fe(2+) transport protein [Arthrobotrys musiformis]|uniref:Low-affinity Fe(2+) transport protein n=1 Tax=Arthrobotrys musiformis TaxID=47236 RepID=A0AAV9W523_9PEZI